MNTSQRTLRNLVIFVTAIVAFPWLGCAVDLLGNVDSHRQDGSLGWLLFILTPLVTVLLLRGFAGDGWKDFGLKPGFRGNGRWYVFAFVYHPLSMLVLIVLGVVAGGIVVPETSLELGGRVLLGLALGLLPSLVKNVFEELVWRGYLAPKVDSLVKNALVGHLIVGVIWMTWHLPYYLVLLSQATLAQSTGLEMGPFLFLGLLGILPTAIIYGELRARTNSVWPPLVLHVTANLFFDTLILQKVFHYQSPWAEMVFSPGLYGVIVIALNLGVGLWLYRTRNKPQAGANLV